MRKFSFSLFVTAMCAWATVSHAEQMLDVHGQYLFGDWQGKRTELAQKGIKFEANAL
ncbi:MAG: carbohydrate porin, partial [Acinetobacter sp.]|nr:carbohydrate porin [Acinetobacter sp.]